MPSPPSTARFTPSVPGSCMAMTSGTPDSRSPFSTSWRVRDPASGTMKGIPPRSLSVTLARAAMGCDGAAISTSSSAQIGSTRKRRSSMGPPISPMSSTFCRSLSRI